MVVIGQAIHWFSLCEGSKMSNGRNREGLRGLKKPIQQNCALWKGLVAEPRHTATELPASRMAKDIGDWITMGGEDWRWRIFVKAKKIGRADQQNAWPPISIKGCCC